MKHTQKILAKEEELEKEEKTKADLALP